MVDLTIDGASTVVLLPQVIFKCFLLFEGEGPDLGALLLERESLNFGVSLFNSENLGEESFLSLLK